MKGFRLPISSARFEHWLATQVQPESENKSAAFGEPPFAVAFLAGSAHTLAIANDGFARLVGQPAGELLGKDFARVFSKVQAQQQRKIADRVYRTGKIVLATESEFQAPKREEPVFLDVAYVPIVGGIGTIQGVLFQGVDVTERVLGQIELKECIQQRTAELRVARRRLRKLTQELHEVRGCEQRRFALDLHDTAGHLITALRWKLESLRQYKPGEFPEFAVTTNDSIALVEQLSHELRAVTQLKCPPLLDKAGLVQALQQYIHGVTARTGLIVHLEADQNIGRPSKAIAATILRVVQEALTNVYRHSQSRDAVVLLKSVHECFSVQVRDYGQGIAGFTSLDDPNFIVGIGIRGMRERVRNLRGSFSLLTGKEGTTVMATLPRGPSDRGDVKKLMVA